MTVDPNPADGLPPSAAQEDSTPLKSSKSYWKFDPRRQAHESEAYRLQVKGAVEGGLKGWAIGGLLVWFMHIQFPLVRRQTLAGKVFLSSWPGVFGMVTSADKYLLRYEAHNRMHDNAIRDQAMAELSKKGQVPTEERIRAWRAVHDAQAAKQV